MFKCEKSLKKGVTPNIRMLWFVIINIVLLNLLCLWTISLDSCARFRSQMLKHSISMGCPKVVNLHYPTSLLIITFGKYIIFSLDFFLKAK